MRLDTLVLAEHGGNRLRQAICRLPGSLRAGLGLMMLIPALAWGQNYVVPVGTEFPVVGTPAGEQVLPALALSQTNSYLFWQDNSVNGGKNGSYGIGGAQLLASTFASGPLFRVNKAAVANRNETMPQAALLNGGQVAVVWQGNALGTPDIYGRFLINGKWSALDLRMNTYLKDQQTEPVVAGLSDGGAVVTWSSFRQGGSYWNIYQRKYLATGAAAWTKEQPVSVSGAKSQRSPAIASLANGNYVVVWVAEQGRFSDSVDVYARVFTPAGAAVTGEMLVNSATNACANPAVAGLSSGGFLVAWSEKDILATTNSWDVWGRSFSPAGAPAADAFLVNTYRYGDQYRPKIASGPTGCLVVWTSVGEDGSREGVYGRFLPGGLTAAGPEFRVNTTTRNQQILPAVAWNGVDRFLVVWSSPLLASGFDLYGQAYLLNPTP